MNQMYIHIYIHIDISFENDLRSNRAINCIIITI